jgi:4-diphosphocytidyl-2C-methyl-D-erythritol kinase
MSLVCEAPAKLNLFLYLGQTREDGLHELVSLFESISLHDRLALAPTGAAEGGDEVVCPGVDGTNLVSTALRRCREIGLLDGPPVALSIEKQIPVAAGLGGGSADAAAALRLVAAMYDRKLADFDDLAFELGADVPSQLRPGATLVQGAGEQLVPVDPRCLAAQRHYVVVAQEEGLRTADVFAQADSLGLPRRHLAEDASALVDALTTGLDFDSLCAHVHNDFTPAILALRPELQRVIEALEAAGASVATFTGSGPTAFGLFPNGDAAQQAAERLREQGRDARAAGTADLQQAKPRREKDQKRGEKG